ncbi:hypothetical protein CI1B_23740 [Bradyrhizobium ivorense]|uniref:Predicted pPIWI-associating nuclease group 2 domain-containing protein n=1 Tax=Bradyrhizobium ivorense TaxID=2511166 RepID=A0A508T318_9BRAD|nr:hypothetical protein CI1B_23740 [Bradyrhizobium ivorense]
MREETILTDDKEIRRLVDDALSGLLDVFAEVHKQLADEIHDAVFDAFLTETLQELDELSTHTTVDDHYVSEVRVHKVDEEFINIVANGTVYVEL